MKKNRFAVHLAFIIPLGFLRPAIATDETRQAMFFDSVQARYLKEYQECTGDKSYMSAKELIRWKDNMSAAAVSKEYLDLLKEYRLADASGGENALPCKVFAWNKLRKKLQAAREDTLAREKLAQEELENARSEAKGLAKSAYDIPGLPFGLSKESFLLVFKNTVAAAFLDRGNYISVNDMAWGNRTFPTAFYFDKTGRFFKYEIESPSMAADRVNSAVRPDAEYLAHELAGRFGEPLHRFSIGFFDLKSDVLCPYKTWDAEGFDACVGLLMSKYRYCAKAVVAARDLRQGAAAADTTSAKPK
jgi:hypothetical protein